MTVCYGDASMQVQELHQLHQLKEGKLCFYVKMKISSLPYYGNPTRFREL